MDGRMDPWKEGKQGHKSQQVGKAQAQVGGLQKSSALVQPGFTLGAA